MVDIALYLPAWASQIKIINEWTLFFIILVGTWLFGWLFHWLVFRREFEIEHKRYLKNLQEYTDNYQHLPNKVNKAIDGFNVKLNGLTKKFITSNEFDAHNSNQKAESIKYKADITKQLNAKKIPDIEQYVTKQELDSIIEQFNGNLGSLMDLNKAMSERLTKHEKSNVEDLDKIKDIVSTIKSLSD